MHVFFPFAVDWDTYFNKETVKSKFEEAGQSLVSHATDVVIDELLSILKIPKVRYYIS